MKTFVRAALLLALTSTAARAQINAGDQKPEASLPFTMTQVATFNLPWRIAFLPDGRMLITEKPGAGLARHAAGREDAGRQRARRSCIRARAACWASSCRRSMRPTTTSTSPTPNRARAARAWRSRGRELAIGEGAASLDGLEVLWRQMPKGKGGQFGAADRLFSRWPVSVPHRRRSPAHDAGAGSRTRRSARSCG